MQYLKVHLKRYLKSVATFGMKIYNLKYNFQSTANQLKNNCHEIIIISHKCRLLPEINLDFNKRNIKSYISVILQSTPIKVTQRMRSFQKYSKACNKNFHFHNIFKVVFTNTAGFTGGAGFFCWACFINVYFAFEWLTKTMNNSL